MLENDSPASAQPAPKKSDRTAVIVAIVAALGLFALIAFNMK